MPFASILSLAVAADARSSVFSLVMEAGLFAKLVLVSLLLMSVISWGIIWERFRMIRRVRSADKAFLQSFRASRGVKESRMLAAQHPHSVLGRIAAVGLDQLGTEPRGLGADPGQIDLATRAMQRARVDEMEKLERNLSFLATTGSVAPFLGLMGTVWGVMTAFLGIGVAGSASLVVVAPGIAEALIATIAGLAAAIPAVIGYNYFVARVRIVDNGANAFISEFADVALNDSGIEPRQAEPEALRREVGV